MPIPSTLPDLSQTFQLDDWNADFLGGGGLGDVYSVHDVLGNLYAIKIFKGKFSSRRARQLMQREVDRGAGLSHRNVASVYGIADVHCPDAMIRQGVLSELVRGQSLRKVLGALHYPNRLGPDQLWPWAADVAAAIDYLHRKQKLHCDIKPENIVIEGASGIAKLIDHGIACVLKGSAAKRTRFAGTIPYMPIEQVTDPVLMTRRGDIYCLAVVLYECLVGRLPLPFDKLPGQVPDETVNAIRHAPLIPAPDIPRRAWETLQRALSRNLEDRPATAGELVLDLQEGYHSPDSLYPIRVRGWTSDWLSPQGWPPRVVHRKDGSEMILVRGDEFTVGHASSSEDNPPCRIVLSDYYIDACPVTNRQFDEFETTKPYVATGVWRKYFGPGQEHHPVRNITHEDALQYCKWAGKSLPTECQWECAARAGDARLYPWGNEFQPGRAQCELDLATGDPLYVGAYEPNPWGLFDMAGNVAEWVLDWYFADAYGGEQWRRQVNEHGIPVDPLASHSGTERVVRGGHWASPQREIASTARSKQKPREPLPTIGFRCVWLPTSDLGAREEILDSFWRRGNVITFPPA